MGKSLLRITQQPAKKVQKLRSTVSKSRKPKRISEDSEHQDLQYHGGVRVLGPARPQRQMGRLPFGEAMEVRLPYVENFAISCSGTTGLTTIGYTFYGNNMYDPRIQVGGHQPMQYDTLATLYWRYRVHDLECCITFSNPLYDGMWVGYRVRPNANTVATAGQSLEYIQEMSNMEIAPLNNTGSQKQVFRFRLNIARFLGVTEAMASDQSYVGAFGGSVSPTTWPIVEPFALHTIAGEDSTVRCNIELIFHALASDRLTVAQS